jgi:hypothetical protein
MYIKIFTLPKDIARIALHWGDLSRYCPNTQSLLDLHNKTLSAHGDAFRPFGLPFNGPARQLLPYPAVVCGFQEFGIAES